MPRYRKPTKVLELNGTLAHNKGRYADRKRNPKPVAEDVGECNVEGEGEERYTDAWRDLKATAPKGALTGSDRVYMEIAARLLADFRSGKLSSAGLSILEKMLSKFGMNPVDRTRVLVGKEEKDEDNEFAALASEIASVNRRPIN